MLLLLALTSPGAHAEDDRPPRIEVSAIVAGTAWHLADGVLTRDGEPVLTGVVGEPAFGARAVAAAAVREEPVHTELIVLRGADVLRPTPPEHRPDRVALAPDGSTVAYVSGHTGWASLWVVPVDGGAPRQLTNAGLARRKGGPPEGFVPPPHLDAPWFDGDLLVWDAPDGRHSVAWR